MMKTFVQKILFLFIILLFIHSISRGQIPLTDSLLLKAREYIGRSMPDEAIPLLFQIIKDKSVDQEMFIYANINLAEAYREKHEHKKGIDLLCSILKKPGLNRSNLAYSFNRMAALYAEWSNPEISRKDSVFKYSEKCLEIAEKDSLKSLTAASLNEIGYMYVQLREYDKALEYCTKAYNIFIDTELSDNAINAAINISGIYLAINQPGKALAVIGEASRLSSEEKNRNLYMRLCLQQAKIFEVTGNYKEAFDAVSKTRELQRGFYQDRLKEQTSEMAAKYDLQIKEQEIKNIETKREAGLRQRTYLSVILCIVVVLFLLSILYFNLKRKNLLQKEQLIELENEQLRLTVEARNKELHYKSKELTEAISNAISMNETLKSINTQIKTGQTTNATKTINNKLDTNLNWEHFHVTFNEIYPLFFNRLNQEFPAMSKNEIRLCAFLLMEMKTKEIAKLMNISETSASKSRNRLRKKLNIETGSDIAVFLKTIATD